jgi:hypothetical protein
VSPQQDAQHLAQPRLVIDDQDASRHGRLT